MSELVLLPIDFLVVLAAAFTEPVEEVLHEHVILEVLLRLLPGGLLRRVLSQRLALDFINLFEFSVGVLAPLGYALHETRNLLVALGHLNHLVRELPEKHHIPLVHLRSRGCVRNVTCGISLQGL